jgi:hypothetical protein
VAVVAAPGPQVAGCLFESVVEAMIGESRLAVVRGIVRVVAPELEIQVSGEARLREACVVDSVGIGREASGSAHSKTRKTRVTSQ